MDSLAHALYGVLLFSRSGLAEASIPLKPRLRGIAMQNIRSRLWDCLYLLTHPAARKIPVRYCGVELWKHYYHLTHFRNLEGIFDHGIMSWTQAQSRKLTKRDIADADVQRRRNRVDPVYHRSVHDYTPLYVNASGRLEAYGQNC